MRRRTLLIAVPAFVAFLAISLALARFLVADNAERDAILGVLDAQARGDVAAVLDRLEDCDATCRADATRTARRVRTNAEVLIARIDSDTARTAFGAPEGWTRVVWTPGEGGVPVVQCFRVRREGNPLTGRSVSLLRLGPPLADNEGSC